MEKDVKTLGEVVFIGYGSLKRICDYRRNQQLLMINSIFKSSIATNFNHANLQGRGQFGAVVDWNPTAPIHAPYSTEDGTDLFNQGRYGYYQPQNGFNPF